MPKVNEMQQDLLQTNEENTQKLSGSLDLRSLTDEEIEKELERRKKGQKELKKQQKEKYEADRNKLVTEMVADALMLEVKMRQFKADCIQKLEKFREYANYYGDIRKDSKGGFSIRNSETQQMVSLDRNRIPEYDERASMAEQLLHDFLQDKIKKRDLASFRTISALLERNKQGDYTPGRIACLLKIKDNYDDPRWNKAMQLFEESFQIRDISFSVSFFNKDNLGKDQPIVLTFARMPVAGKEEDIERE